MANEEQLSILKQGVQVWNKWREKNPNVKIDLTKANLQGANLSGIKLAQANLFLANLSASNLRHADLSRAELGDVIFRHADLYKADLSETDLVQAQFGGANLYKATFKGADLGYAQLVSANLSEADLESANLSNAYLPGSNLSGAKLSKTNFKSAGFGLTIFGNVDLSEALGLDTASHSSPSTLGTDTFALSKGSIPEKFMRGCGLSDWEIQHVKLYKPNLTNEEINNIQYKMYDLRAIQALQISPLFISYSHADGKFVDKLEGRLNRKGVRFWRDVHDMKAGRIEKQIDNAISHNRTVLLILSKNSLKSDWVEHEVRTARGLEKEVDRDVLCPVALDDSWKSSPWPKRVMEQIMEYNILDFSAWEDDNQFDDKFRKLIDGLELFYKG